MSRVRKPLRFEVEGNDLALSTKNSIRLSRQEWNDWFTWRTLFNVTYFDNSGLSHDLGAIKIVHISHDYSTDFGITPLPATFASLGESYASLGQDEDYYARLRTILGAGNAVAVLNALRDLSVDLPRFEDLRFTDLVSKSLMRYLTAYSVRIQYPRIIKYGTVKASFDFTFNRASINPLATDPLSLDFAVVINSTPPTNVHVLIGRNGAGKTSVLRSMGRRLLGSKIATDDDGYFTTATKGGTTEIANLVYVAFSAFDEAALPVADHPRRFDVPYSYIGLQYSSRDSEGAEVRATRLPEELGAQFCESAWNVVSSKSSKLWTKALANLESDSNFREADVSTLAEQAILGSVNRSQFDELAGDIYSKLSSGHRIVLLTVTRLVESVAERTLVLLDEPEAHLHPPLLSAFTRTLSDLMRTRNGLAIVATHSPVILQEVPKSSVYRMRRSGDMQSADRVGIETFGENVGTLTNTVFGLEVTQSGFNRLLLESAEASDATYDSVLRKFHNDLGFEARSLLRAHFLDKED